MADAHVMVVTPHPDDAEFGAAGSVARWVKEGKKVVYVVCTSGEKGTDDPAVNPADLAALREKEQEAAAALLGVSEVVFLRYGDQTLEDTPEFRKEIVRLIRIYRPQTVVTVDPYRRYIWHRDHRITGQVVLMPFSLMPGTTLPIPSCLRKASGRIRSGNPAVGQQRTELLYRYYRHLCLERGGFTLPRQPGWRRQMGTHGQMAPGEGRRGGPRL